MASSLTRFGGAYLSTVSRTRLPLLCRVSFSPETSRAVGGPSWQALRFKRTRQEPFEDPTSSESAFEGRGGGKSSKGGKKGKSSAPVTEEDTLDWPALFEVTEQKMGGSVEHFLKELGALENRASGRVNAALLDLVRVQSLDGHTRYKLSEVATIGVKEGSTLVITVFDEKMLRKVEQAILNFKLPGAIPQIASETVIRIPMPKPTMESRQTAIKEMAKLAETTRIQIRNVRQHSAQAAKGSSQKATLDKTSPEAKRLQTLTDKYIKKIDDSLKKSQSTVEKS